MALVGAVEARHPGPWPPGEGSGNLAVYRVDPETGQLTGAHTYPVGKSLTWALAVQLGQK
jgi:hypothetical protein